MQFILHGTMTKVLIGNYDKGLDYCAVLMYNVDSRNQIERTENKMKAQITYKNTYGTKRKYTVELPQVEREIKELKECKLQPVRVQILDTK